MKNKRSADDEKKGKWTRLALIAFCEIFLLIFLAIPLVYILCVAFREGWKVYYASISDEYAVKAAWLTARATAWAVGINTIFGLCAAWALTKFAFCGKKIISALIDLPVTVSPIIAGLIFVLTFGRQSFLYPYLEKWGIQIIFAEPGIVLATIFVTFPFISRELIPVLNAAGTDEEEAAALMGASAWTIFRKVTFPHIKWSLLYGIVLCSARAMGEFGAVSVLSGHLRGKTNTLPLYVELLYQGYDYTGAFAASSLLVVMTVVVLVLRVWLEKRGGKELDVQK
ncbi:MAG: sulfate ABC transporter permease subunit CysW [Thermoguttaceae bacterium]|nr:sulfate ABC transporter permease subunit CysW [Thermoguttaceae bacterium]